MVTNNFDRNFLKNLKMLSTFLLMAIFVFSCTPTEEITGGGTVKTGGTKVSDTTPPTVEVFDVINPTAKSFTIKIKADENATVYFSVNEPANVADTKDKVVNGTNAVYSGNFQIDAGIEKQEIIQSNFLQPSTNYKCSIVVKDASGNFTSVQTKDANTVALDTVAPTFTKSQLTAKTTTTANFETTINKNGKIFYIVVAKDSSQPTGEQVKAGVNYGGVTVVKNGSSNYGTSYNFQVTGLTLNTEYDLYLAAENMDGTLSSTLTKVQFKTLSGTEQEWSDNKLPKIGTGTDDVTDTSIKIFMAVKKTGKIYGVILPKGATAPTATQVMEGKDANGNLLDSNYRKNYTIDNTMLNTYKFLQFTSLTPNTDYDIYCTAGTGSNGNEGLIEPPYKLEARTKEPDMTPPQWSTGHPKYDTVTENSFKFYVAQNKLGTIYVIIVPGGSPEPTIDQIKAQADYGTVTLVNKYTKTVNTINYSYTQTISGLTPNTTYDVYSVGESGSGVLMPTFDKKSITTIPSAPAEFQSISPATGATNVSLNPTIVVTFTQNLNTTIKGTVTFNGQNIPDGQITVSGKTVSIQLSGLNPSTTYTGISLTGFKDASNNNVNHTDNSYSFTTGTGSGGGGNDSLVFANSDFEADVDATLASGFTATRNADNKYFGNNGIRISGTMGSSNANFYSVNSTCNSKGSYSKITFWLKVNQTSSKGLVIRIDSSGSNYYNINDDTIGNPINVSGSAVYSGKTLSARGWTKIELNISTIDPQGKQFFIRGGSSTAYDISIDHIIYE